jgi:hypothetical protein
LWEGGKEGAWGRADGGAQTPSQAVPAAGPQPGATQRNVKPAMWPGFLTFQKKLEIDHTYNVPSFKERLCYTHMRTHTHAHTQTKTK